MPKPICVKCGTFFKPKKNGVFALEQMPNGTAQGPTPPGTVNAQYWQPYKIWVGDLYECHSCGTEIVHGYSGSPISEHYKGDFGDWMNYVTITVNDC